MKINFYNKKVIYVSLGYLMVFNKNFNWYRLKKKISLMYLYYFIISISIYNNYLIVYKKCFIFLNKVKILFLDIKNVERILY